MNTIELVDYAAHNVNANDQVAFKKCIEDAVAKVVRDCPNAQNLYILDLRIDGFSANQVLEMASNIKAQLDAHDIHNVVITADSAITFKEVRIIHS